MAHSWPQTVGGYTTILAQWGPNFKQWAGSRVHKWSIRRLPAEIMIDDHWHLQITHAKTSDSDKVYRTIHSGLLKTEFYLQLKRENDHSARSLFVSTTRWIQDWRQSTFAKLLKRWTRYFYLSSGMTSWTINDTRNRTRQLWPRYVPFYWASRISNDTSRIHLNGHTRILDKIYSLWENGGLSLSSSRRFLWSCLSAGYNSYELSRNYYCLNLSLMPVWADLALRVRTT